MCGQSLEGGTRDNLKKALPRTLRGELIVVVLAACIVPLIVYVGLSLSLASRGVLDAERDHVRTFRPAVQAILNNELREQRRAIEDYAHDDRIAGALSAGDVEWLGNLTSWLPGHFGLAQAAVLDLDGMPITPASITIQARLLPGWPFKRMASTQQDFRRMPTGPAIVTVSRITDDGWSAADGVLVLVRPLDWHLLHDIRAFTGASSILLLERGHVLASSQNEDVAATFNASSTAGISLHSTPDWLAVDVPLTDQGGSRLGVIRALAERTAWGAASGAMYLALGIGLALVLLATFVLAPVYARRVSRRLTQLTCAARAIAAGEEHEPLPVTHDDEISRAQAAFNDMSSQITRTISGLTGRLQSLGSELAELTVLGDALICPGDMQERLTTLCGRVADAFRADVVVLYLRDSDGQVAVSASPGAADAHRAALQAATEYCVLRTRPLLLEAEELNGTPPQKGAAPLAAALVTPLVAGGHVLGALGVASTEAGRFDDHELLVLSTVSGQVTVALRNAEVISRLEATNLETVRALATAMEAKDQYTAEHAQSLALMAVAVGQQLGLSEADLRQLEYAALLHDIGKIGVPGAILNKPEQLTDEEFAEIAKHTILGEHISSQVDDLKPVAVVIRSAHERWDGHGYPDGLSGEQIPLMARILLVCDAFDAMTSNRPYRPAMPMETAMLEIRACAGMQFDPAVVEALFEVWDRVNRLRTGGSPEMPVYIWQRPKGASAPA